MLGVLVVLQDGCLCIACSIRRHCMPGGSGIGLSPCGARYRDGLHCWNELAGFGAAADAPPSTWVYYFHTIGSAEITLNQQHTRHSRLLPLQAQIDQLVLALFAIEGQPPHNVQHGHTLGCAHRRYERLVPHLYMMPMIISACTCTHTHTRTHTHTHGATYPRAYIHTLVMRA